MAWGFDAATAVSGSGDLAVTGQAAAIVLTAVPIGYGRDMAATPRYLSVGYVAWLVGARAEPPVEVDWVSLLVVDAPRGVTGLRYSFLPGVTATIAVGYWLDGTALGSSRLAPVGASAADPGWMVLG